MQTILSDWTIERISRCKENLRKQWGVWVAHDVTIFFINLESQKLPSKILDDVVIET